eukprot:8595280-Pyramimonas_sp.AAC.1
MQGPGLREGVGEPLGCIASRRSVRSIAIVRSNSCTSNHDRPKVGRRRWKQDRQARLGNADGSGDRHRSSSDRRGKPSRAPSPGTGIASTRSTGNTRPREGPSAWLC